jgi:hypothetical protein
MALSTRDTGLLTRVASFPRMEKAQRKRMLLHSSNEARAIGRIIIDGEKDSDRPEYRRVAAKFSAMPRTA